MRSGKLIGVAGRAAGGTLSGDFVAELQRRLSNVGSFTEEQINGNFDQPTQSAVMSFQGPWRMANMPLWE